MKKSTLKGIIVVLVAVIVLSILTAAIGSSWFTNGNIVTWFNSWGKGNQSIEQTGNVDAPDLDYSESPNGSTVLGSEDNGIQLLSAVLPRAAYAANGVAETADSAYSLTAEIKPDYATDKTVDWSVAWQNSASEWAEGETVTDYVTVTPSSDGALTAVATCLQDFGEPIILTVSSRSNPEVSGICIMGYYQRVKSVNYKFSFDGGEYTPTVSNGVYLVDYTGAEKDYIIELEPVYSNYTVADTYTTTISGALTSKFGYTASQTMNTLKITAGLTGGDPELTQNAALWCSYVYSLIFSRTYTSLNQLNEAGPNRGLCLGTYGNPQYKLTDEEKMHPRCAYYISLISDNSNFASVDAFNQAKVKYSSYQPAPYTYYGASVKTYNDFVTAVKACNSAKVGVIQYTIKFVGTYSSLNTTLNVSYNDDFKISVDDVGLSDGSLNF